MFFQLRALIDFRGRQSFVQLCCARFSIAQGWEFLLNQYLGLRIIYNDVFGISCMRFYNMA
jgi:hypothetical protein